MRAAGLHLTISPIHRHNIDEIPAFIDLALELDAEPLEIANVQYAGWALLNRNALMPDRAAAERQLNVVREAQERLHGVLAIDFVTPDYFAIYPKRGMGGWARDAFVVAPDGTVLPCHAAGTIHRDLCSTVSATRTWLTYGTVPRYSTPFAARTGWRSFAAHASARK